MRNRLFAMIVVLLASLGGARATQNAVRPVSPQKTWVIVVGLLKFEHEEFWCSFSPEHRRDLEVAAAFHRSGVPADQMLVLTDEKANRKALDKRVEALLARTRPGDRLFFYYGGHGWKDRETGKFYCVPYDGGQADSLWEMSHWNGLIQNHFHGSAYIAAADCCNSGCIPEYARASSPRIPRVPWGGLSSSGSNDFSTEHWTFTDCLIDAINGDPVADRDGDGAITYSELSGMMKREMQFFEGQSSEDGVTPGFDPNMPLFAVARPLRIGEGRLVVGPHSKGRQLQREGELSLVRWNGRYGDDEQEWLPLEALR